MKYLASGAIGTTITAKAGQITYLPEIQDLRGKTIKYIDCVNGLTTQDVKGTAITANPEGVFLTLMQKGTKNYFVKDCPISNYMLSVRKGNRDNVIRIVDFSNSFVDNKTNSDVVLYLVFWYDDEKLSNLYDETQPTNIDAFEVSQFSANENRFYFQENRTLYNKEIQLFTVPFYSSSFVAPSGKTTVSQSVIKDSFVTLQKNNFQFLRNVPLMLFVSDDYVDRIILQNIVFDFTNSYIEIPTSLIASVSGKAYFINCEYKQ